jgi:hypothetical protein
VLRLCQNGRPAAKSAKLAQHLLHNIFSRSPVDRPIIECRIQELSRSLTIQKGLQGCVSNSRKGSEVDGQVESAG